MVSLGGFSSPSSNYFISMEPNVVKEVNVLIKNIPLQIGTYNVIVGWYGEEDNPVIDIKNFGTSLKIIAPEIKMLAYGTDGLILFDHESIS